MSDNKKKDGANSASKGPSKGAKGVCERLSKMLTLVSEIENDPAGFAEHEAIVADRELLKKKLDEKDEQSKTAIDAKDKTIEALQQEISELKSHKQRMWNDFEARFADFIEKTGNHEALEKQLEQVTLALENSNERCEAAEQANIRVKRELDDCKADLVSAESRLMTTDMERERLDLDLRTKTAREQELIQGLELHRLDDSFDDSYKPKFEDFADRCHQLALEFFQHNITEAVLGDLRNQISEPKGLQLSSSDTLAARLARCAFAESIIASAITYHIFAEIPFPNKPNVQWSIRAILDLFESHSSNRGDRQNIVRCQLLAEYAEMLNDEETGNLAIENAVRECVSPLHHMLADSDLLPKFKARLRGLCKAGLKLWSPLKWNTSRIVADCSPNIDSFIEEDYDDAGIKLTETAEQERRAIDPEPVLQLFPRILLDKQVLMEGYVLASNQRAVFTPKKTASNRYPPQANANGHARLSRSRTDSFGHNSRPSVSSGSVSLRNSQQRSGSRSGPAGALQSPPASPTTDRRNGG